MSNAAPRLIPKEKFKKFLDALVHQEHIPVSEIGRTERNEHMITVGAKTVFFSERHTHGGERGIKESYLSEVIDAAALKYGQPGSSHYDSARRDMKKLARKVIGF